MGQTSTWKKFWLLLWKNFIMQKRQTLQTIFEVLIPVLFASILVVFRTMFSYTFVNTTTYYHNFTIDSLPPTLTSGDYSQRIWRLGWTPNDDAFYDVMQRVGQQLDVVVEAFDTESDMVTQLTAFSEIRSSYLGGVVFATNSDGTIPNNIEYTIRLPGVPRQSFFGSGVSSWHTDTLYARFLPQGPRDPDYSVAENPGYYQEGFLAVQHALDVAFTELLSDNATLPQVLMRRYPAIAYLDDEYLVILQLWLPLIVMTSFIYTVMNIVKSVVYEKEKKLKESMKIMGLPGWLHWCAWFVRYVILIFLTCIFMTLFLCVHWFPDSRIAVLSNSNIVIVFLYFFLNGISLISFSFLMSTFFSKASSSAVGSGVIYFLSFCPYFFIQEDYQSLSLSVKCLTSLLSTTAAAYGGFFFAELEALGEGAQWDNIYDALSPTDTFCLGDVFFMMFADFFIYLILALYLEAVFPGEFGVPQPWYFPFTRSFWCGYIPNVKEDLESEYLFPHLIEEEPEGLHCGIHIKSLTKVYGENTAVSELNLSMYEDQITVLLGHNGAGKTTTMSMLTGMFPSTSGTAIINGHDIWRETNEARGSLGLCPQHDVLFDELTVAEHIYFFGSLKGLVGEDLNQEIDNMVASLDLKDKRDVPSRSLSGGMKRKLSVGIALCANSKVVLLDEPSSGMDPGARRFIWDLLLSEKAGRTVLLTTHFMEEADVLGDRIAIMATGELQCCGSPLFLKTKLGSGYRLTLVKKEHCETKAITEIVERHIPEIIPPQEVASELSYVLPEAKSSIFPDLFSELESNKEELGIDSFGASMTSTEDVFIKVSSNAERRNKSKLSRQETIYSMRSATTNMLNILPGDEPDSAATATPATKQSDLYTGGILLLLQWRAMLTKKFLYCLRSWILVTVLAIIPAVMLTIIILVLNIMPTLTTTGNPDSLTISLNSYSTPVTLEELSSGYTSLDHEMYSAYATYASGISRVIRLKNTTSISDYILSEQTSSMTSYTYNYIAGATFGPDNTATSWFNNQPFHSPALALNMLSNGILQSVNKDYKITTINHPLPYDSNSVLDQSTSAMSMGFQIGFNINFGLSFVSAGCMLFLIKERVSNSKHLQYVSGVNTLTYWMSTFIIDYVLVLLSGVFVLIVLFISGEQEYVSSLNSGVVVTIFMGYGWCAIPLAYLASFAFEVPATGFAKMCLFNVLTGAVTSIVAMIVNIHSPETLQILNWPFMLFPNYNVGMALQQMYSNYHYIQYCSVDILRYCPLAGRFPNEPFPCCKDYGDCGSTSCFGWSINYFSWEPMGIGRNLFMMYVEGIVLFFILFLYDMKVFYRLYDRFARRGEVVHRVNDSQHDDIIDEDVAEEKRRIANTPLVELIQTDNLIVKDLGKWYGDFEAVKGISIGVQKGECFGLLGINGAGKTTTFKMLTGDLSISCGNAVVGTFSVRDQLKDVQKRIGYCPQFDAVIGELTGMETLHIFGLLRGVPETMLTTDVAELVEDLSLTPHIHKRVSAYSGGNKRKLSVAVALLGDPPTVFLDEPTTGMDPVARRHLWKVIVKVRARGKSIVLTSHSMEECEALCTRIAIMVGGQFRCLGSVQHLKNRFAQGYTLTVKVHREHLADLRHFVETRISGCVVKDVHQGTVQYTINNPDVTWSSLFASMEEAKAKFDIEAYSVGETTLEQVFLSFSKYQVEQH